jgi:hypothetical protein
VENVETETSDKPKQDCVIVACGELTETAPAASEPEEVKTATTADS